MKESLTVKFRILFLALSLMTLQGSALFGAFEWLDSVGSGDWETDANWKDGTSPNATDAEVLLKDTTGDTTVTITSGGGRTVGSLSIENQTNVFTLDGTKLIFNVSSGNASLSSKKGSHTVSADITLRDGLTISNEDVSGTFTISGGISEAANLLTVSAKGDVNISGIITGSGGLTKTETGTLTLSATNLYTGTTSVTLGTVVVTNSDGLGRSSGSNNGTTVSKDAVLSVSGSGLDISEKLTLDGDSADTDGELRNISGINTWSGTIALSTNSSIGVSTGTELTVSGVISGSAGLTKEGAGTLTLTGVNTFSGDTTIDAGTLKLNSSGNALDSTSNIVLNTGGTLLLGASDQIDNDVTLKLLGGTFNTAGFDETMESLTLTKTSTIDFASSSDSVLEFTSTFDWNFSTDVALTLLNFNGSGAGLGGNDELIFGTNPTSDELAQIQFLNPTGYTPGTYIAKLDGTNLIPDGIPIIPEPSAMIGTGLMSGLILLDILRRRKQRREEEEAEAA